MLVVDVNGFQLKENHPVRSPFDAIVLLLRELALYKRELLSRQILLVLNKMDADQAYFKRDILFNELSNCPLDSDLLPEDALVEDVKRICSSLVEDNFSNISSVSAITGDRIDLIKQKLHKLLILEEYENDM